MQCPKWNNKRKATLSLWELRYTVLQSLRVSIYQISCINRPFQLYLERLSIRSSARNQTHRTWPIFMLWNMDERRHYVHKKTKNLVVGR